MKPRFATKAAFNVIGVFCRSTPSESLHKLWNDFSARVQEIPNILDQSKAYQVCVFEDANPEKEEYTFIAGMEVKDVSTVPEGMLSHKVQEAHYAIFEHKGLLDTLHKAYEYIFAVWLPDSGYQMVDADSLEVYDERFQVGNPESVFEIWVPVKK